MSSQGRPKEGDRQIAFAESGEIRQVTIPFLLKDNMLATLRIANNNLEAELK